MNGNVDFNGIGFEMNFSAIGNLGHRLKLVGSLPPRLVLAKIAKRLPWSDRRAVRIAEIVHSPKDLKADRLIGFFRDQEAILVKQLDRKPMEFSGRKVIEIGPGPLAGWGPMAIFRGAEQVYGIEPDWVEGALLDPAVEDAYLRPHHLALTEAFGTLMDYTTFRDRLAERLRIEPVGLAEAVPGFHADVVMSNSCLEHIAELGESLSALRRLCAADVRYSHLVNFGNHRNRRSPFATIYEMTPDEYQIRYGRHINLLRASEVEGLFSQLNFEYRMVIADQPFDRLAEVPLHEYWRDKFTTEDLATRTALFVEGENELTSEGET